MSDQEPKLPIVERLSGLFPNAFKNARPEQKLKAERTLQKDNNATLDSLNDYEGGEQIFSMLQEKLAKDNLHIGRYLGSGRLAMVFAVEDNDGNELKTVVARVEHSIGYGKPLSGPLVTQRLYEEQVKGKFMHTLLGSEEEMEMNVQLMPLGVPYSLTRGDMKFAQLDDLLELPDRYKQPGEAPVDRKDLISNVMRTMGYLVHQPPVKVYTRIDKLEDMRKEGRTVDIVPGDTKKIGDDIFVANMVNWHDAIKDISPLSEDGAFLTLPTADGKDVIRVNGQPLMLLSDAGCGGDVQAAGLTLLTNPEGGYFSQFCDVAASAAANRSVMPLSEIERLGDDDYTRKLQEWEFAKAEAHEKLHYFVPEALARGGIEHNEIDKAVAAISERYLAMQEELLKAGVPAEKIHMPDFVGNFTRVNPLEISHSRLTADVRPVGS